MDLQLLQLVLQLVVFYPEIQQLPCEFVCKVQFTVYLFGLHPTVTINRRCPDPRFRYLFTTVFLVLTLEVAELQQEVRVQSVAFMFEL